MATQAKLNLEDLADLDASHILALRFCDIDWSEPMPKVYRDAIAQVERETVLNDINFKTKFYIAKEWMSPEDSTAIGIPFYLLHHKLAALEIYFKHEAEGAEPEEFLKLLRHEMGHCFDHAYGISKKRDFAALFGSPLRDYRPEFYTANQKSREYVTYLSGNYSQAHPLEDFAETFAVWLDPSSKWRVRYAKDPAVLKKLQFVEAKVLQFSKRAPLRSAPLLSEVQKSVIPLSLHYKRQVSLMAKIRTYATMNG